MATAIIPVVLEIEKDLLPEEIVLVKDFIGLFHKKGSKTQAVTVRVAAAGMDLSSTSLDADNPYAEST